MVPEWKLILLHFIKLIQERMVSQRLYSLESDLFSEGGWNHMKLWLYPLKILRIIRKEYSEVTLQEVLNCAEEQIKSLIQYIIVYLGNLLKKPVGL